MLLVYIVVSDEEVFYHPYYLIYNYVNKIITCLKTSGAGCYFVNGYVGCIMYVDDLLLLSGSVLGLQAMLHTCGCVDKQLKKIALHDHRS